jgi:hypothetical protein
MRTKALLLAAAFAAAGVSTSVAQVYSVNAVGYVNVVAPQGYSMVSNPLNAGPGNNTIGKLFANITPSIPAGSAIVLFDNSTGTYKTITYSSFTQSWGTAADSAIEILPGNGVFFRNQSSTGPVTITFVGEVMQGNLVNPLPLGFSIKANQVPQAVSPTDVGFPGTSGDRVYVYRPATSDYSTHSFSSFTSSYNPPIPAIKVGEAFFVQRQTTAGTWNRTFSVN